MLAWMAPRKVRCHFLAVKTRVRSAQRWRAKLIRAMIRTAAKLLAIGGAAGGQFRFRRSLVPLLILLTGCAQPETRLGHSSLARGVSAQEALALPPPGTSSVVGVVERRYSNAIQHDIALTTNASVPGQNLLRVQMFGPVGGDGGETALVDRRLQESDLRREMRDQLPGIAMQRSPLYVQNSYGPFGYAIGTSGSDRCLYAWQRIAGTRTQAPFLNTGSVQVRLRVCETWASEQGLLAFMYGYTINASFLGESWNPYGAPSAADPRLGNTGQPIVASVPRGYDDMLDPLPPAPPAPTARRAAPAAPAAPPVLPAPIPGAPIVPPPPAQTQAVPAPVIPPPPVQ